MNVKGLENPGYDARTRTENIRTGPCRWHAWGMPQPHGRLRPGYQGRHQPLLWMILVVRLRKTRKYAAVYDTLPLCKFIRRSFTGKEPIGPAPGLPSPHSSTRRPVGSSTTTTLT